jgi:hypothetical protein
LPKQAAQRTVERRLPAQKVTSPQRVQRVNIRHGAERQASSCAGAMPSGPSNSVVAEVAFSITNGELPRARGHAPARCLERNPL